MLTVHSINKKLALAVAALLITLFFTACADKPAASGEASQDYGFAEPLTDNILAGLKDRDYAEFSRDMSDAMKAAMGEESFFATADMLEEKIGDYVSREFGQAEKTEKDGREYILIAYAAKYTEEAGNVIITVSFSKYGEKMKVEGLWFNSEKLR